MDTFTQGVYGENNPTATMLSAVFPSYAGMSDDAPRISFVFGDGTATGSIAFPDRTTPSGLKYYAPDHPEFLSKLMHAPKLVTTSKLWSEAARQDITLGAEV